MHLINDMLAHVVCLLPDARHVGPVMHTWSGRVTSQDHSPLLIILEISHIVIVMVIIVTGYTQPLKLGNPLSAKGNQRTYLHQLTCNHSRIHHPRGKGIHLPPSLLLHESPLTITYLCWKFRDRWQSIRLSWIRNMRYLYFTP